MSKHIVIYSHGFGVGKDDRGLFPDIASALPNCRNEMFDYNHFDEARGAIVVSPFDKQAAKLSQVITQIKKDNPEAIIDMICHSQGCVTAAMACQEGIRKSIFLAPPDNLNIDRLITKFDRPGSTLNVEGESLLVRRDGGLTIVPKEYWSSIRPLEVLSLYDTFGNNTDLTIIDATEDETLGNTDFSKRNESIKLSQLAADHNFTGESRDEVKNLIVNLMQV
jgi:hypothetical protein